MLAVFSSRLIRYSLYLVLAFIAQKLFQSSFFGRFRIGSQRTDTMAAGLDCLTATISDIQENYTNGSWTAVSVLNSYLAQIDAHDQYLHAIIQLAPRTQLLELAQSLDEERKTSGARSPLHGIPVLVKVIVLDAIALGLH